MGDTVLEVGVLPPKGSRTLGVSASVAQELAGEIFDRREYSASNNLSFDTGKPDFDLVEPGRISGCEVPSHARMRLQESCHVGCFVVERLSAITWICWPGAHRATTSSRKATNSSLVWRPAVLP